MHKMPVFLRLLFVLALAAAVLACNIGVEMVQEWLTETCNPVDRDRYERAAAELGQVPETPDYPEGAVYEVCFNNKFELTSVRMSEGYRPTEGEGANDGSQSNPDSNPDLSLPAGTVPAGTYTGQFIWGPEYIYTLLGNEINISISPNGTVSGTALFHYNHSEERQARPSAGGGQCTYYYEFSEAYVVSGQIAGDYDQPVQVALTLFEISNNSTCGFDDKRRDESCTCQGMLTVRDGQLTITCGTGDPCGAYLTALLR